MQDMHLITFEIKKLAWASQLRRPIHEKKLFAIANYLKTWHCYLRSQKKKVFTNYVFMRCFKMKQGANVKQLH
jgi:hypothetical protein